MHLHQDVNYLNYAYHVITNGIEKGYKKPNEWLQLAAKPEEQIKIPEFKRVGSFYTLLSKSLFQVVHHRPAKNEKELKDWIIGKKV